MLSAPRLAFSLAALALLLTTGCPGGGNNDDDDDRDGGAGGSGGGGVPPGMAVDADELAAAYGDFACEFIERCGRSDFAFNIVRQLVEAGGDCEGFFARTYRAQVATDDYVAELRYDPQAFTRCRERALESCVFGDGVPGCEEAVRGRRAADDPCTDSTLCTPGLFCDYGALAEGDCRDVCAPRKAPGEACDNDGECAHAADRVGFCRRVDGGGPGVCATAGLRGGAAVDAPCGLISEADGFTRITCADGAYCDADGDQATGACQPLPGPGEACQDGAPCSQGICANNICVVITIVSQPGAACDIRQLQVCNLVAGLTCVDGACVASQGQAGQACTGDDDLGIPCQPGLYCGDADVCVAALADGEACDPDGPRSMCQSGDCAVDPATGDGTCGASENACE